jgi:hypothetical protein
LKQVNDIVDDERTKNVGDEICFDVVRQSMCSTYSQATLQNELESRTHKHDMQLLALKDNLVIARTELKSSHDKLKQLEQMKIEKAGRIDVRIVDE